MQYVYVVTTMDGNFCGVCSTKEKAEDAISRLNEIESLNPRNHWKIVGHNIDGLNARYS